MGLAVSKVMSMAELEAAIEDWEQVYEYCKLRREFGPLPVLIEERRRRIEKFDKMERENRELH